VGRSARQVAGTAGSRVRDAVSTGRDEMLRREEELWAGLASQGVEQVPPPSPSTTAPTAPAATAATAPAGAVDARSHRGGTRTRVLRRKSPSHLGK
jgi:hypothetical protein